MIETVKGIRHTDSGQFFLLAGPCAIEGERMALEIAEEILRVCDKLKIPYVSKAHTVRQTDRGLIHLPVSVMKRPLRS